jgi:glycogen synthase
VVATDQATRAEVPDLLGVPPEKVAVLPNGIDLDEVERLTPADPREVAEALVPALAGAAPVLLSVGRLEAYKGLDRTVEALGLLQADGSLPARWAWVVAGAGRERERLRGALGPGLAAHVHFTGAISETLLHALYARADALVHATLYEGSSLVTLEAMSHGVAVLATRVGGIPDKVVPGETGWLVPPGDVAALAGGLREIVHDLPGARARGERGRERVRRCFAWPVLVDRTIALYEELLRA